MHFPHRNPQMPSVLSKGKYGRNSAGISSFVIPLTYTRAPWRLASGHSDHSICPNSSCRGVSVSTLAKLAEGKGVSWLWKVIPIWSSIPGVPIQTWIWWYWARFFVRPHRSFSCHCRDHLYYLLRKLGTVCPECGGTPILAKGHINKYLINPIPPPQMAIDNFGLI